MQEYIMTKQNIKSIAKQIAGDLLFCNTLFINGNLGSGKTFLTKYIIQSLTNKKDLNITSPTFNIVNIYNINEEKSIYHFDLYRIKSIQELENIGFFEYLETGICIIEWGDIIKKSLQNYLNIDISIIENNKRLIQYVRSRGWNVCS